jgi:crossover junction endodeoxyribonuclease RuvC
MKYICGIDPGLTGAVAILGDDYHIASLMDMPMIEHDIDWPSLKEFWDEYEPSEVWIEKCQAMPKQGISSTFHYAMAYGQLVGICKAFGIRYSLVRPQTWKAKELKDMPKEKYSAVLRVNQLYPDMKLRKTQHGRADSILIARHGVGLLSG